MGEKKPLKLVFMGTPDLAATILDRLLRWDGGRVVAVYSQPDRPAGRGMSLQAPPVKELALLHNLPVYQPLTFKDAAAVATLRDLAPDYLLVAAYGLLLPQRVLDIPTRMPINVHTSLLPRYRGAAPIQRAIMDGNTSTGVTIMRMEAGLDTGPVILQRTVPIESDATSETVHDLLAAVGADLLIEALDGLEGREGHFLTCTPQDHTFASYAAKLQKSDGRLDFSRSAHAIHAQRRGVTPWPGAFGTISFADGASLEVKILDGHCPASSAPPSVHAQQPGSILPHLVEGALAVACADGVYLITALRPAGRKAMDAPSFLNGYCKDRGTAFFTPIPEA